MLAPTRAGICWLNALAHSSPSRDSRLTAPIRATVNESRRLVELCTKAESAPTDVTFDCSSVTQVSPFALAMLASSVAVRRSEGRRTMLLLPTALNAARLFADAELVAFAEGHDTGIRTLGVRQLTALSATYPEAVVEMLANAVPQVNEETAFQIQLCLNELLQNVFEWAESPRWLLRIGNLEWMNKIRADCSRRSGHWNPGRASARWDQTGVVGR